MRRRRIHPLHSFGRKLDRLFQSLLDLLGRRWLVLLFFVLLCVRRRAVFLQFLFALLFFFFSSFLRFFAFHVVQRQPLLLFFLRLFVGLRRVFLQFRHFCCRAEFHQHRSPRRVALQFGQFWRGDLCLRQLIKVSRSLISLSGFIVPRGLVYFRRVLFRRFRCVAVFQRIDDPRLVVHVASQRRLKRRQRFPDRVERRGRFFLLRRGVIVAAAVQTLGRRAHLFASGVGQFLEFFHRLRFFLRLFRIRRRRRAAH